MIKKIFLRNKIVYVYGNIFFSDVNYILNEYENIIVKVNKSLVVSFRFLKYTNTSILILVLNFVKISLKNGLSIKFIDVPFFLFKLSKSYSLNFIFEKYYK